MFEDAGARPPTYNWIKPRRVALATASVRLMTFILAKMAFTCDFTVPSLMNNAEPISLLLFRSEEHTSELQSHSDLVCRLLLEKKKTIIKTRERKKSTKHGQQIHIQHGG